MKLNDLNIKEACRIINVHKNHCLKHPYDKEQRAYYAGMIDILIILNNYKALPEEFYKTNN